MGNIYIRGRREDAGGWAFRGVRIVIRNDGPDPVVQLVAADNFADAVERLGPEINVNQRWSCYENMTLLEKACCVDHDGRLVKKLQEKGARADDLHPSKGCRAIHMAANHLNLAALRLLLQKPYVCSSDPNALTLDGDNVLHVLCKPPAGAEQEDPEAAARRQECVTEVLRLCAQESLPLDVNHLNRFGQTPIFLAAKWKNEPLVNLLLGHGCSIDSDDVQQGGQIDADRLTTRRLLQPPIWPEFQLPLPSEHFRRGLFFLLYYKQEDEFLKRFSVEVTANLEVRNAHDGKQTLLQVAVENGLERAVKELLNRGADANLTQPTVLTACEDAAYQGFSEILRLLIPHAELAREKHLSAMHWLIKGADIGLRRSNPPDSVISKDYKKCFEVILAHEKHKTCLNARDHNDCTPLHLAVLHHMRDPYFVDKLIDRGALLGLKDKSERTPFDIMSLTEIQKFFDRRIEVSDHLNPETHDILEKMVIFDIQFLRYFDNNEVDRYDCQTLAHLSKCSVRRTILTHPLVESFIYMKWNAIWSFYVCFLMLYVVYTVLLVSKVSLDEYFAADNSSLGGNMTGGRPNNDDAWQILMNSFLTLFLIINLVVTVVYYLISWDSFYSKKRCFLKMLVFIFTLLVLLGIGSDHIYISTENPAIFLASLELVLLLGDHPKCAARVKTLKTVASQYLIFFGLFLPLLFVLALNFVTLFRNSKKSFLYNLSDWFVNSLFMFGKGHKVEDLMDSETNPLNHLILISFVFILALVFSNVLNGHAVKDTITINNNVRLHVNVSLIELLCHAERALHKLCTWRVDINLFKNLEETLTLKPFLINHKIIFKMEKKNKWTAKGSSITFTLKDSDIITRAEDIKKLENADVEDLLKNIVREKKK